MDGLAERLKSRGYARLSARDILRAAAHFSRYAMWLGVAEPSELTMELAERFLKEHLPDCCCERLNAGKYDNAAFAVQHALEYLQDAGIINGHEAELPADSISVLLLRYSDYLAKVRGLAPKSIDLNLRFTRRFLEYKLDGGDGLDLSGLDGKQVLDYFAQAVDERKSLDWRSSLVSSLRSFLRFLRWEKIIGDDLSRVVPSVIRWKLADVPRHIPFKDVRKLIEAPNISTAVGKRDRAILMLLGLLGMRGGEVAALKLDDIDWPNARLVVQANKVRKERVLPLPPEVGEALYDYIRNGRPRAGQREVFMRSRAPLGPISSAGSLVTIVRKYIHQTGIDAPKKGTHLLRHSLATRLVNAEVPMKDIADILGHASIETTTIYAKVDKTRLKRVALPFPKTSSEQERDHEEKKT
jgi:site-specific recombinase XerD